MMADALQPHGSSPTAKVYTPWPEAALYLPGEGNAPTLKPYPRYGDVPEVGDVPRIGSRVGDPRCNDITGVSPCGFCVLDKVEEYLYEGKKFMPGLSGSDAEKKNWFTGLPDRHPHPFAAATPEMNVGRGCDTYGQPYGPPERFTYLEIHRFDEALEQYVLTKGHEVDWGPEGDTEEFKEGMRKMRETPTYKAYERQMLEKDTKWRWKDLVDPKPWDSIEKVMPNPWINDVAVEHPIDQHVERLREWASEAHEPWPTWPALEASKPIESSEE